MSDQSTVALDQLARADPEDVDKVPVIVMGDCPNCGPHSLATVKVSDAEYITSCSLCDYEQRCPVIIGDDGKPKVSTEHAEEVGIDDD